MFTLRKSLMFRVPRDKDLLISYIYSILRKIFHVANFRKTFRVYLYQEMREKKGIDDYILLLKRLTEPSSSAPTAITNLYDQKRFLFVFWYRNFVPERISSRKMFHEKIFLYHGEFKWRK